MQSGRQTLGRGVTALSEEKTSAHGAAQAAAQNAVVIKKYANRRLYNTSTSTYVTLDDLSTMVKGARISWSMTPRLARTSRGRS